MGVGGVVNPALEAGGPGPACPGAQIVFPEIWQSKIHVSARLRCPAPSRVSGASLWVMTTLHQPGLDTQLRDGDTQLMDGACHGGLQPRLSCPSPFPTHMPRDVSQLSIPG